MKILKNSNKISQNLIYIVTTIAVVMFFAIFQFVNAQNNYTDKADIEVYNQLNNSEWVRVIVDVDSKDSINKD